MLRCQHASNLVRQSTCVLESHSYFCSIFHSYFLIKEESIQPQLPLRVPMSVISMTWITISGGLHPHELGDACFKGGRGQAERHDLHQLLYSWLHIIHSKRWRLQSGWGYFLVFRLDKVLVAYDFWFSLLWCWNGAYRLFDVNSADHKMTIMSGPASKCTAVMIFYE